MGFRAEALLYAASRAQHVKEVIRPALEAGHVVLCERYILPRSPIRVTGAVWEKKILQINDFATDGLMPDLTLFFSVDPRHTLARKAGAPDRLEEEGAGFHGRVYEGYMQAVQRYPGKVVIIDATKPEEEVFRVGREALLRHLRGE